MDDCFRAGITPGTLFIWITVISKSWWFGSFHFLLCKWLWRCFTAGAKVGLIYSHVTTNCVSLCFMLRAAPLVLQVTNTRPCFSCICVLQWFFQSQRLIKTSAHSRPDVRLLTVGMDTWHFGEILHMICAFLLCMCSSREVQDSSSEIPEWCVLQPPEKSEWWT